MFALSALAIALTVVSSTAASSASQKNTSLEYLLSLTSSPGGRPDDAPIEFSCAWRRYATAYAMQIHPKLSAAKQRALHDALQLSGLCNQSFAVKPRHHNLTTRTVATTPTNGRKIYVNPTNGSNSGTGSQTAPLKTLHAAVAASRIPAHSVSDAPTIILCGGVYYLANHEAKGTVVLTPSDSGLTIQAMEGETPILSGGRALTSLKWSPLAQNARAVALHNAFRTTLSTADAAALPVGGGGAMPALHSEIGNRYTLARYPNANAELDLFPAGHIIDKTGTAWMTPRYNGTRCTSDGQECGQAKDVIWSAPQDEWHGMYQDYMVGVGGACDAYEPPYSPWCAQHFYAERWSEMHYRHPAGITPNATTLPHFPYKNATGAVLHVWRPGHWYTWMFEVNATTAAAKQINMTFGRGGNQGGEGSDTGDEWWIENVPEELDAANEYYYDPATRTLDIVVNTTTDGTSPGATLVVPTLATLIELRGTQQSPVTNVTLLGLVFTASRPTFFDPRANPSGGDWALERLGALLVEGANSLTVRDCNFTRLDSNAISMNGYTRDVVIDRNHFEWLGQNAIASWGRSNYFNGTDGNFPRGTIVTSNWAIEVGILQKQSSFYFQAETAETTLANNIVFNIPRAAINFNDGFGGGAKMHDNLLFNTCRESSDHGAFNSWDRLPYLTTVRNGTASTVPAMNEVYRNFIVANYAADGGCLDNDDGSSYYDIHHNFCVYGGHKADFDGHTKFSRFNVHVYPSVYASTCVGELQALPKPGYAERYTDNVCILPTGKSSYLSLNIPGQCDGTNLSIATFHAGMVTRNNTIYVPGACVLRCSLALVCALIAAPRSTCFFRLPSLSLSLSFFARIIHSYIRRWRGDCGVQPRYI